MDNSQQVPDLNQLYGAPQANPTPAVVPDLNQLYGGQATQPLPEPQTIDQEGIQDVSVPDAMTIYGAGKLVMAAPTIASATAEGFNALKANAPNMIKGLLSSPSAIGEEMESGEEAAGISSDTLPVRRGTMAKFPGLDGLPQNAPPVEAPTISPSVYPKDTNTLLNFARQRIDSLGEQMQPQELADYRVMLNTMFKNGEIKEGTKAYALASQLYSDVNSLFENAVAGRSDLNEAYRAAKMIPNIGSAIGSVVKKYGPFVARGIFEGAGLAGAWQGIKHLF